MNNIENYFEQKQNHWNPNSKTGIYLVLNEYGEICFGQEDSNFVNAITRIKKQLTYGTFNKAIQSSYDLKRDIYFIEVHKILQEGVSIGKDVFHFYRKFEKGELLKFYNNAFYGVLGQKYVEYGAFVSYFGKNDYSPEISRSAYQYFESEYKRFVYYTSAIGRIIKGKESLDDAFPDYVAISD